MKRLLLNLILFLSLTSNTFAVGGRASQPILSQSTGVSASATGYSSVQGESSVTGTETARQAIVPVAGTSRNFAVVLSAAPDNGGGTQSITITLRKNSAATTQTCTVSEANTTCSFTGDLTWAAGDRWAIQTVPSGTPTVGQANVYFDFIPDTTNYMIYGSKLTSNLPTVTTTYYSPFINGIASTTEVTVSMVVPLSGTLRNLYFRATSAPNAACADECSWVGTMYLNGSPTAVNCLITNSATNCSDLTHNFAVAAGDVISFKVSTVSTIIGSATGMIGFVIEPTLIGGVIFSSLSSNSASSVATNYLGIHSAIPTWNATETLTDMIARPMVMNAVYGIIATAPGAGRSFTYTVNNNTVSTSATIAFSGASQVTNNLTGLSIGVTGGDLLDWQSVPAGTPTGSTRVKLGIATFVQPRRIW